MMTEGRNHRTIPAWVSVSAKVFFLLSAYVRAFVLVADDRHWIGHSGVTNAGEGITLRRVPRYHVEGRFVRGFFGLLQALDEYFRPRSWRRTEPELRADKQINAFNSID